jgi:hypothetical protein
MKNETKLLIMILKILFTLILGSGIIYLLIAFVFANIDFRFWSENGRISFSGLSFVIFIMAILIFTTQTDEDEKQTL